MVRLHRGDEDCPRPAQGSAVTIGAYDGVHRGHQAVIGQLRERASARGLATAVVTFDRHPAEIVRPASAPLQLTDTEQEVVLLGESGVDHVLVLTFDEARAKETAEEFVHEVLVGCLNAKYVLVGADFHFGHERRGNVELLRRMGEELGFEVEGLELVGLDGAPAESDKAKVSSTAIRHALAAGDLESATTMLGRLHEVRGTVEHGDHRGRDLGFPTANVAVRARVQLPADGIYAVWYERPDSSVHPGAASLGRRPTFYDAQPYRLLEVHLLDGDYGDDLYGEAALVRFVASIRGEERFDTVSALVEQMHRDCEIARTLLNQS